MLDRKRAAKESVVNRSKVLTTRKTIGASIVVGFYLLIWALNSAAQADDDINAENLIALHDSSSPQYNQDCMECHADILTEQSLNPAIPRAHVAGLPFKPGEDNEDKCVFCHRSVDLLQGMPRPVEKPNGNLRKHVDSAVCALCHGPSGPGTQFYQAGLDSNLDGAALYDLVCSGCHRGLANSEVKGESATEIQEKIAENEGGMGPLGVLTTPQILAIADALTRSTESSEESD